MKGQGFIRRLRFALLGLRRTIGAERSFRTHLVAAAVVLAVLLAARPAPLWWAILGLAVGLVLMAELFNTALETLIDHLHPEQHPEIGAAKDIAAAAVLVASGAAVVAGLAFAADWLSR
ncbi:diacylglycerol kinase [Thauera linaloolentis]|uniref:Diacylglycerol kinase n=1 Tax=Thauera linaloolentis (strain DSM 12138 / JCM 21573 / CCUG 41526 / CIP 105981 / IAM 15112 / NBRC 102519 / 47Lol) TaxID=1123367 RepID=N6YSW1_THAL4|nr:diacylglycerol kinase [Thauera linaloolentis]ENO85273.1 diacylglycerol kinase [Thauera linaloolentis 47Lol = DSM 12138]MCM8564960.1 diacylglycerol kinase [Thauera linaloolentis]